jgi:hypothetical protein
MDYGSPNKNLNKGYKSELVKTERSNLINDNPVAKDASGGRPMILKHMSGSKGSPLMAHLSDSQEKKLPSELKAAMHK